MTWQDLKDDLDRLDRLVEDTSLRFVQLPIERVARRVLNLWKPCFCECHQRPESTVGSHCSPCHGTGIRPTDKAGAYMDDDHFWFDPQRLARYLFGEDTL